MQKPTSDIVQAREADPLVPTVDPQLESKISSILNRMPQHLRASGSEKTISQSKSSLSKVLQNGPFSRNAPLKFDTLVKHNDLLFKTPTFPTESQKNQEKLVNGLDNRQVEAIQSSKNLSSIVASDKNNLNVSQQIEKVTTLRDYQDVLNQRVENALRRSQEMSRGLVQSSVFQKATVTVNQAERQPQYFANVQIDTEQLDHRVEEALKRSEMNLKRSGIYDSRTKVVTYNQSSVADYGFLSPQTQRVQNHYADISALESKYKSLSSPRNFLKTSIDKSNIDVAFNEALKRSEALLRQNEGIGKGPAVLTKFAEVKSSELYSSFVQEKFTSSIKQERYSSSIGQDKFSSSVGFLHRTPPKEKNLHIFHNAIKTLSPAGIYSPQYEIKPTFANEQREDGTDYSGEMLGGKRHGRGVYQEADGSKYDGEWEDGERNGYGTQVHPNGEVLYEGEWANGKYHGSGILFNASGKKNKDAFDYLSFSSLGDNWEKYEGEFENGRWHGLGTLYLRNGEKFVGKFRFGQVHGKGTFYQSNGKNVTGEWREDKFAGAL